MAKNTAKPSTHPLFSWVETLLTSKKPLEQRNKELNFASAWADDQSTLLLLLEGADPNSLNNGDLRTAPLFECVNYGTMDELQQAGCFHRTYGQRVSTVTHLIRAGANIHCKDKFGYTPLHRAAFHERGEVVALLLKHGADPTVTYFSRSNNRNETPIEFVTAHKGQCIVQPAFDAYAEQLQTGGKAQAAEKAGDTLEAIRLYCEAAIIHAHRYGSQKPQEDWSNSLIYSNKAQELYRELLHSPTKTVEAIKAANSYLENLKKEFSDIAENVYGFRIINCEARGEKQQILVLKTNQDQYNAEAERLSQCMQSIFATPTREETSVQVIPVDSKQEERQPLFSEGIRRRIDPVKRSSTSPEKEQRKGWGLE